MSAEHIAKARAMYATDDIEIDDEPMVSRGEDGVWVAAWVWVPDHEVRDEEEE